MNKILYDENYDYERYMVFDVDNPKIIMHIAKNLDVDLFKTDEEGYSYYGFFIDKMMGAIVVVTKNEDKHTIRMVFDGSDILHIEGADKAMHYSLVNKKNPMTLNQFLRINFKVNHAIDKDDPDYGKLIFAKTHMCQWGRVPMKDTL